MSRRAKSSKEDVVPSEPSTADLNARNHVAWEENAQAWDERMAEAGNDFHRLLVGPALDRLLDIRPGARVLDACCGNGLVSRRLAACGAYVTAFDFSASLIAAAQERSRKVFPAIDYRVIDATDPVALHSLGQERFDAVVCAMALMDMPTVEPLAEMARRILHPQGCFVFAIPHPCFNTSGATRFAEAEVGDESVRLGVKVWRYKTASVAKGKALSCQPAEQLYFERPLEMILGTFFRAGFVLDGLEEPAFPADSGQGGGELHWRALPEIPPVLVRATAAGC